MGQVIKKTYNSPPCNSGEILRYAGVKKPSTQDELLVKECLKEAESILRFNLCYSIYPLQVDGNKVDLGFTKTLSKSLAKNLKGCDRAIVFCATLGLGIDRLIAKYGVISPAKALIFQAIGSERIESLCDLFNKVIAKEYKSLRPRFSPGYGDLALSLQADIFSALDCSKKIGVNLTKEFLMTPSKSVTAIIGISNCDGTKEGSGCSNCDLTNCEFRRI